MWAILKLKSRIQTRRNISSRNFDKPVNGNLTDHPHKPGRYTNLLSVFSRSRRRHLGRFLLLIVARLAVHLLLVGSLLALGVGCFYLTFYALFSVDYPYLTGMQSGLRLQPSLAVIPRVSHLSSIIHYSNNRVDTFAKYVDALYGFVQFYEPYRGTLRLEDCKNNLVRWSGRASCMYDLNSVTSCIIETNFGYEEMMPCVALKMNRVIYWVPEVEEIELANGTKTLMDGVGVECRGRHENDRNSIKKICYFDEDTRHGTLKNCKTNGAVFKHYYFPYKKQGSYHNPLVFLKFIGIKRHMVIMMECWLKAKNIHVDLEKQLGSVRFEIMMD